MPDLMPGLATAMKVISPSAPRVAKGQGPEEEPTTRNERGAARGQVVMSNRLYEILGVERSAPEAEIKSLIDGSHESTTPMS